MQFAKEEERFGILNLIFEESFKNKYAVLVSRIGLECDIDPGPLLGAKPESHPPSLAVSDQTLNPILDGIFLLCHTHRTCLSRQLCLKEQSLLLTARPECNETGSISCCTRPVASDHLADRKPLPVLQCPACLAS